MKWLIRLSIAFNVFALFINLGALVTAVNNSRRVVLPLFWICLNTACIILLAVVIPRIEAKTKRLREAEDQRREKLIAEYSSYMPNKARETMVLRSYQRGDMTFEEMAKALQDIHSLPPRRRLRDPGAHMRR